MMSNGKGWFILELVSEDYGYVPPIDADCIINDKTSSDVVISERDCEDIVLNKKVEHYANVSSKLECNVTIRKKRKRWWLNASKINV